MTTTTATILDLSDLLYNYERSKETGESSSVVRNSIIDFLTGNQMTPLYLQICSKYDWQADEALLTSMREANEKELENIEAKRKDAEVNAGDMEVVDSMFARARYFSKIGDWVEAFVSYDNILKKEKTSTGKKIDANMEKAKIALFNQETKKLKELISESKRLVELGGDWDRRNRLKVYEAHYFLLSRDIKQAAKLFLDCIATFTCTELCSYKKFMLYALLTNIVYLNRNDLRKKVINDPHVITVIRELPNVQKLLHGIYNCDYNSFFKAILGVFPEMMDNSLLGPISTYLIREYRVLAYSQFLEAYKSVMLSSMSTSFGVSSVFLDNELSKFISSGRINAKIDKVGDIIETSRPDKKNAQYQVVIKKGDVLLNQIQKLVRVIDV